MRLERRRRGEHGRVSSACSCLGGKDREVIFGARPKLDKEDGKVQGGKEREVVLVEGRKVQGGKDRKVILGAGPELDKEGRRV